MSEKMVLEAKRKDGKIQEDEGVSCCHKGIRGRQTKKEKLSASSGWLQTKGTEEHPIAKARLLAREFNTGDKRGELFAGTPGLMAMRTVISRVMTKCENGTRRCQDSLPEWRRPEVVVR